MNMTNRFPVKPNISSSPNRTEKFQPPPPPPPLTGLLRTNAPNRSRSRSRSLSSPMFSSAVRSKKVEIETQEPSSPKVTCVGQIRIRKTKSSKRATPPKPKTNRSFRSCRWLQRVLCCYPFTGKSAPPAWQRWFTAHHRRKFPHQIPQEPDPKYQNPLEQPQAAAATDEVKEAAEPRFSVSSSPPKNALFLMRCRSEPRRGENRFGFSLSPAFEGERVVGRREEDVDDEEEEDKIAQLGVSSRPLILTRCKSEPASRTGGAKLGGQEDVFFSFGKRRKMTCIDRCQPHVYLD